MRRHPPRVASSTPTTFSGILKYNESYHSTRDRSVAIPSLNYRSVSRIHFKELSLYLAVYLEKFPPNSRSTARQKLTRLTIQQFHELSTDVYDELIRRKADNEAFLHVRPDFHPKRNQARQKLATLPTSRFEDLSSDVYYELFRRYPEFKEDPSGISVPNDRLDPNFSSPGSKPPVSNNLQPSDLLLNNGHGLATRRPTADERHPSNDTFGPRSGDSHPQEDQFYVGHAAEKNYHTSSSHFKKPLPDRLDYGSTVIALNLESQNDSGTSVNSNQSTIATSGIIIPNKSTIEEEYIEVPFGLDIDEKDRHGGGNMHRMIYPELESESDYQSPRLPLSPPVGLNGLKARLGAVEDEDEDDDDRYGDGHKSSEDIESIKRQYEEKKYKMQTQMKDLQRELAAKDENIKGSEEKFRHLEKELAFFQRRAEEQSLMTISLQKELDAVRELRRRETEEGSIQAKEIEAELRDLKVRYERLSLCQRQPPKDVTDVEKLRCDVEGLFTELDDLTRRNDELMIAKDSDMNAIRNLDIQLKEYKRKYEQAKTELRSFKVTSQLYLLEPRFNERDDQLPVAPDGCILDIHITRFLSAIDNLLAAGRSNTPTRVLVPMKTVVNSVASILKDVQVFECRVQRDSTDTDLKALYALRERAEATLSNLTAASKTHATSWGLSPVSLLDAAASHVSATVTELTKAVSIRKASDAELEQFSSSSPSTPSTDFSLTLRSVGEVTSTQRRKGSVSSIASRGASLVHPFNRPQQRPPSGNSSSEKTNSPPLIFDHQPVSSDGSVQADSPVGAWSDIKPYLEAQTESIVFSIQAVLTSVRNPVPPPTLAENLTQIITSVTSIITASKDNLPQGSEKGKEILQELSQHANKLSKVQTDVSKESRQIMAKSSFAIANAMKCLTRL